MNFILLAALLIAGGTVAVGVYYTKKETTTDKIRLKRTLRTCYALYIPVMLFAVLILVPDIVYAATEAASATAMGVNGVGLIAAALSTGLACIGCGYAVGAVGSSALGAVSEDPNLLGRTLIFVGLAEGIAIYGLIISILILGRL